MSPALIIIDLQNDFVSAEGALKKKHIPLEQFLPQLRSLCAIFKGRKWPIIAVRSEYANISEVNEELGTVEPGESGGHLTGTHRGKRKFCTPDTKGAEFHPEAEALFSEFNAIVLTKTMYSAFAETSLQSDLQAQNVSSGPIYFAGVTANNCVLASLTSAFQLGYNVCAIEDCIGATNELLKAAALKKINTYYGDVISSASLTPETIQEQSEKPHRILYWVSGSIPSWRVMLALSLKRIPHTAKRLHVMTSPKETRAEEFKAINPRGKTPTLIDVDGTVIIESMAILQYLETYYPTTPLTPPQDQKAAHTLTLQRFHETENLHNAFEDIEFLYIKDWASTPGYRQRIYDAYTSTIHELRFWEGYLGKTRFVTGDEMGLADCAFYPNVAYLCHRGLDLKQEGLGNLNRYVDEVARMQCARDALPVRWETRGKNLFVKVREIVRDMETLTT